MIVKVLKSGLAHLRKGLGEEHGVLVENLKELLVMSGVVDACLGSITYLIALHLLHDHRFETQVHFCLIIFILGEAQRRVL